MGTFGALLLYKHQYLHLVLVLIAIGTPASITYPSRACPSGKWIVKLSAWPASRARPSSSTGRSHGVAPNRSARSAAAGEKYAITRFVRRSWRVKIANSFGSDALRKAMWKASRRTRAGSDAATASPRSFLYQVLS